MSDKTVINNWNGGGTLQTWTDGEWQILYAKDSAGNCVTLSLNSGDAIRLAYAVSPTPSEIFERMRAANEAVYEMSYPEARADELRHIADEIDCGGGCEECSQQKLDRGEFCGFVAADNMRKLATALELKSKIDASRPDAAALSKPAPVAANASAEARLREALEKAQRKFRKIEETETWTDGSCLDGYRRSAGALRDFAELAATEIGKALSAHPHASDCDKQKECCDLAAKEPCADCPFPNPDVAMRGFTDLERTLLIAAKAAQNYIANTESELGMTLKSGDLLRAAIAKAEACALSAHPHASDCDKQKECCDLAAKEPCPGKITKPGTCHRCNKETPAHLLDGHHHDYSKPLEVKWLCRSCHGLESIGADHV